MAWKHTAYVVKEVQYWSHAPKAEIEEKYTNNFYQSVQKHWREGEGEQHNKAIKGNKDREKNLQTTPYRNLLTNNLTFVLN